MQKAASPARRIAMRKSLVSLVLGGVILFAGTAQAQPVPGDLHIDQVLQWVGQMQPTGNPGYYPGQPPGDYNPGQGYTPGPTAYPVWTPDPWVGTNNQRGPNNPGTNWNPDGTWNPYGYQLDPPVQPPQGPYK
jgi:hypothetical protein